MHRAIAALFVIVTVSCAPQPKGQVQEKVEQLRTLPYTEGTPIRINFERGPEYYHPLIVFWIEDTQGNFLQTIYASKSIATGVFRFGEWDSEERSWKPGERRRPAALPYWTHRRGYQSPEGLQLPSPQSRIPDAVTGATPKHNFVINTFIPDTLKELYIYMELNQTWDWNHHWHNNRYPDDDEYKTSAQPALVYRTRVNTLEPEDTFEFEVIGHSHPSGANGNLFPDVSTFTTALDIAEKISLQIDR